ncbi:pyoverdine/dityrosine biosynthesis protein [Pochonia chlamydosporia 170]|uniref:Pyoverdine/dityrosine biosynthesis protein n=1 Tax=Pochonia chlamydosporia 170 TaxID=1380566 RepID=A0A179FG12_METCM|nr:pyoverdine/dityrosine biosynthesis protein [Pochonia chlamydosporia 170]OAQ64347.1 pyoverdine/dityrosine biosynthesis protein [Pochonia chlamydosporia 170]
MQLSSDSYVVFESITPLDQQVFGLVLNREAFVPATLSAHLDSFFAELILSRLALDTKAYTTALGEVNFNSVVDSIVDLFDSSLRYVAKNDKWSPLGREVFRQQVGSFVSRGAKVEFCLPAFPCKSSSKNKVLSDSPDRGEHIALSNLHTFIQKIEAVYPPGGKLWIISDGHVFSDCIGVDDMTVDKYGAQLKAMNKSIADSRGGKDRIGFKSLPDLFGIESQGSFGHLRRIKEHLPETTRYISTKTTEEADLCRKVLTMGFRPGNDELQELISVKDAALLALYRGFSRFMLEDLATNRYTSHLSRAQLKKRSAKVAKEMIQRNQCYSNLVQMLFPHHVRLSIHAHDNSGPKFGIQMLGKGVVPTDVFPPNATTVDFCDQLHVPTPWHNCIVQIEGHSELYITKASAIWPAIRAGDAKLVRDGDAGEYVYFKGCK